MPHEPTEPQPDAGTGTALLEHAYESEQDRWEQTAIGLKRKTVVLCFVEWSDVVLMDDSILFKCQCLFNLFGHLPVSRKFYLPLKKIRF